MYDKQVKANKTKVEQAQRRTDFGMNTSLAKPAIDRPSIDRSRCANDGWSFSIDHPCPSIDSCTVRHVVIELKLDDYDFYD